MAIGNGMATRANRTIVDRAEALPLIFTMIGNVGNLTTIEQDVERFDVLALVTGVLGAIITTTDQASIFRMAHS